MNGNWPWHYPRRLRGFSRRTGLWCPYDHREDPLREAHREQELLELWAAIFKALWLGLWRLITFCFRQLVRFHRWLYH